MPAGDNSGIAVTQRPGQVPGTSVVTGANGEEVTVPNAVAENILSRPDFTSADVAGETAEQLADPAGEMARALGYDAERSPEDMAAALSVADQAIQLAEEQAQAEGYGPPTADLLGDVAEFLAPSGMVATSPDELRRQGRDIGAPATTEPPAPPITPSQGQRLIAEGDEITSILPEDDAPQTTTVGGELPRGVITTESGSFIETGESTIRPRRRRSPVTGVTALTQSYEIPGMDPELEANARRLEDELANTLASIQAREAVFQGELAGIETQTADRLLRDRQETAEIARQAAVEQRRSLETLQELNQAVMQQQIDPTRFFSSRGGSARFSAAASVALGTMAQALAPGMQNTAMSIIDNAIERDINAQVNNLRNANLGLDRERNILQDLRNVFRDEFAARESLRSMYITEAERRIASLRAQATSEQEVANANSIIQDLRARRARTDADIAARAGTIAVAREIQIANDRTGRLQQRELSRLQELSPDQRAAVNYRRVLQGLDPLGGPAAAESPAAAPRPPRPPRPPGTPPTPPEEQEIDQRQRPAQAGSRPDPTIRSSNQPITDRHGTYIIRERPIRNSEGAYAYRVGNRTVYIPPDGTVPEGAQQRYSRSRVFVERLTPAEERARLASVGYRPLLNSGRVLPPVGAATDPNAPREVRAAAAALAAIPSDQFTEQLERAEAAYQFFESLGRIHRFYRDYGTREGTQGPGEERARREVTNRLSQLKALAQLGASFGVISGEERDFILGEIMPGGALSDVFDSAKRGRLNTIMRAVRSDLEANEVWRASIPANRLRRNRAPASARATR